MKNLFLVLILFLTSSSWAKDSTAKEQIKNKFISLSDQQYQIAITAKEEKRFLRTFVNIDIFVNQFTHEERYLYTYYWPDDLAALVAGTHRADKFIDFNFKDLLDSIAFNTSLPNGLVFSDILFNTDHSMLIYLFENEYLDLSMISKERLDGILNMAFEEKNLWINHVFGDELEEHGYNESNYKDRSNNQPNNQLKLNYDNFPEEIKSCLYDSKNNVPELFVTTTANNMTRYVRGLNQGQQFNVFSELNPAQDCHIYITIDTEIDEDTHKIKIISLTGEINYYPKAMTVQISHDDILKLTGLGELL